MIKIFPTKQPENIGSWKRFALIAVLGVFSLAALLIGCFAVIRIVGKTRLQNKISLPSSPIRYEDKLYAYNENLYTFLIMGIDRGRITFEPWEPDPDHNGQADALFLAVLDVEQKTIKVVGINRNTMTTIYDCDDPKGPVSTFPGQIALQHAYGENGTVGCKYQLKVVQNLFYQLPIHGYAAVNVDVVPTINDMVGGVEVEVLEDITLRDPLLFEGNRVRLMGESAYWYVKHRDINQFASVDMRTKRQSQYLNGFIDAAKRTVREDPVSALRLYAALLPQMDTDISTAEAVYLASLLPQCRFDADSFYKMPGETVSGEKYEEFYPDEDAFRAMILEIFYKEAG